MLADVGYSSAVADGSPDGPVADPVGAALEAGGASAEDGEVLGPGTSTCTFGGAPFGCGITMIGPTRTGPTCTGPTVTGAGRASAEGLANGEVAAGSVLDSGREVCGCVEGDLGAAGALVPAVAAGGGLIGTSEVPDGRAEDGTSFGRAVVSAFGASRRDGCVGVASEVAAADGSSPAAEAPVLPVEVVAVGSAEDAGTVGWAGWAGWTGWGGAGWAGTTGEETAGLDVSPGSTGPPLAGVWLLEAASQGVEEVEGSAVLAELPVLASVATPATPNTASTTVAAMTTLTGEGVRRGVGREEPGRVAPGCCAPNPRRSRGVSPRPLCPAS